MGTRIRLLLAGVVSACVLAGCGDPVYNVWVRNRSGELHVVHATIAGELRSLAVPPGSVGRIATGMGNHRAQIKVYGASCRVIASGTFTVDALLVDILPNAQVDWAPLSRLGPPGEPVPTVHLTETRDCL